MGRTPPGFRPPARRPKGWKWTLPGWARVHLRVSHNVVPWDYASQFFVRPPPNTRASCLYCGADLGPPFTDGEEGLPGCCRPIPYFVPFSREMKGLCVTMNWESAGYLQRILSAPVTLQGIVSIHKTRMQ